MAGISALVASQPLSTWKEYLVFHVLERASPLLPRAFDEESFAFYGAVLGGAQEPQPRWRRAVTAVDAGLGEAVGRIYVQRHFSAATKARAEAMVADLLSAFGQRIDALDWMAPQTKAHARAKLATMRIAVGYPERWIDYSGLEVRRDDALGNAERAALFDYRRNLAKLGHPVDHDEWYLLPQEVNALNLPLENRLIFPAAILEAPFFDGAADGAVNYGAMGAVIGHEISHSFDSSGALFDESGRLSNWWTPQDLARFEAASAALATQFDAYEPLPGLHVNGKLTLGENIADVAGLATAYDAYEASHRARPDARRLHPRAAAVPLLRPDLALRGPRALPAQPAPDQRARAGQLPRADGAQRGRLVRGLRRAPGRGALPAARRAREGVVSLRGRSRTGAGGAGDARHRIRQVDRDGVAPQVRGHADSVSKGWTAPVRIRGTR